MLGRQHHGLLKYIIIRSEVLFDISSLGEFHLYHRSLGQLALLVELLLFVFDSFVDFFRLRRNSRTGPRMTICRSKIAEFSMTNRDRFFLHLSGTARLFDSGKVVGIFILKASCLRP